MPDGFQHGHIVRGVIVPETTAMDDGRAETPPWATRAFTWMRASADRRRRCLVWTRTESGNHQLAGFRNATDGISGPGVHPSEHDDKPQAASAPHPQQNLSLPASLRCCFQTCSLQLLQRNAESNSSRSSTSR